MSKLAPGERVTIQAPIMTQNMQNDSGKDCADELSAIEQFINEGKHELAIAALHESARRTSNNQEKEFIIGRACQLLENPEEAIQHFLKAIFVECPHISAADQAVSLLLNRGLYREARYILRYVEKHRKGGIGISEKVSNNLSVYQRELKAKTIVAIHQPLYLPWLGYIHKIFYADKFVIYDSAEFTKKSFIKRAKIRKGTTNEPTYLTVPCQKHSDHCLIQELLVDNGQKWRQEHLNKIKAAYSRAPHFQRVYPEIAAALEETRDKIRLVEISAALLQVILRLLKIDRPLYYSSDLLKNFTHESAHEKNMKMCRLLDADIYFSGTAAEAYQSGQPLHEGISINYQRILSYLDENPYMERDRFVNGLSSLDALFFAGPEKVTELLAEYENPSKNVAVS